MEWHINADEPRVLDYNVEFKTPRQQDSLYNAEPYRPPTTTGGDRYRPAPGGDEETPQVGSG